MDQADREDYLEAVIMHSAEGRGAETLTYLSGVIERDADQIGADLRILQEEGDLVIEEDGSVKLTDKGRSTGESVLKKHRILECFFTEMLGMDPDTASKEACEIEHAASEDTVEKIGNLLSVSGSRCRGWRHGPGFVGTRFSGRHCRINVIDEYSEGDILKVAGMRHGPGGERRLIDLGIIPGEVIRIVRKRPGGSMLISGKGTEIALSREIAGKVLVEKIPDRDRL